MIIKADADLQGDSIRLRVNDVIQATEDDLVDTDKPDIVNDDLIRPETEDLKPGREDCYSKIYNKNIRYNSN